MKIILFFIFYFHHTRKYVLDSSIQISRNLRLIKNNILAISLLVLRIFQKIQLYKKVVREWLDYGQLRGIGQWRNSGKGRFTYIAYEVKA